MNYVLLICILIIWVALVHGFVTDNMGIGWFGRVFAALAQGALATIALAALGGLTFVTVLAFKEIV